MCIPNSWPRKGGERETHRHFAGTVINGSLRDPHPLAMHGNFIILFLALFVKIRRETGGPRPHSLRSAKLMSVSNEPGFDDGRTFERTEERLDLKSAKRLPPPRPLLRRIGSSLDGVPPRRGVTQRPCFPASLQPRAPRGRECQPAGGP